MTEPNPSTPTQGVPAWRARLLDRIQNLAADRARVLQQGYQLSEGEGASLVLAWRTQLQLMAISREEIEIHALAVGIERGEIEDAALLGNQGFRADSGLPRSGDPVREMMIDGVANDTWQLQHMAAIHVAREQRQLSDAWYFEDPQVPAQYERNMASLWMRASAVSRAISLSAEEYQGMWATDADGWQRILAASVDNYDSQGLEERWRVYAWHGIAEGAHRVLNELGMDPSHAFAIEPIPSPRSMLESASHALNAEWPDPQASPISHAVETALPIDADLGWATTPEPEGRMLPPGTDISPGAEL